MMSSKRKDGSLNRTRLSNNVSLNKPRGSSSHQKNRADVSGADPGAANRLYAWWHDKDVTPRPLTVSATTVQILADKPNMQGLDDEFTDVKNVTQLISHKLNEKELESFVDISLHETETFCLFSLPSLVELRGSSEGEQIRVDNLRYTEFKKAIQETHADKYVSRKIGTISAMQKTRGCSTEAPPTANAEIQASGYDIHISMLKEEAPLLEQLKISTEQQSEELVSKALSHPGIFLDVSSDKIKEDILMEQHASQQAVSASRRRSPSPTRRKSQLANESSGGLDRKNSNRSLRAQDSSSSARNVIKPTNASGSTTPVRNKSPQIGEEGLEALPLDVLGQNASSNEITGGIVGEDDEDRHAAAAAAAEAAAQAAKLLAERQRLAWRLGADTLLPSSVSETAKVLERCILQSGYHDKHLLYRNFPSVAAIQRIAQFTATEKQRGGLTFALDIAAMQQTQEKKDSSNVASPTKRHKIKEGSGAIGDNKEDGDDNNNSNNNNVDSDDDDDDDENSKNWITDGSEAPRMEDLLHYDLAGALANSSTPVSGGLAVSSLDWNSHQPDILAAGYGSVSSLSNASGSTGCVAFWSLRNPIYPERLLRAPADVTSVTFSNVHANIVAAGLRDGSICLWDVRQASDRPALSTALSGNSNNSSAGSSGNGGSGGAASNSASTSAMSLRHKEAVWGLKFVDRGVSKMPREFCATAGADGNVVRWDFKRGLEASMLMAITRGHNPNILRRSVNLAAPSTTIGHDGKSSSQQQSQDNVSSNVEGSLFRKASILSIDFPCDDPTSYVCGTEDGMLHLCSTNYSDAILDSFSAHAGPVYETQFSPFEPSLLLTASADWSVKLWSLSRKECVGYYASTDLKAGVTSVNWSPNDACSFASCSEDGRVEVWHLSKRPMDPVATHFPGSTNLATDLQQHFASNAGFTSAGAGPHTMRTAIKFSAKSPVLAVGNALGGVDIVRLFNSECPGYSLGEQRDRLNEVVRKKLES